jgi:hypothetical protein
MTAVPALRRLVPAESIGNLSAIYAHRWSSKSRLPSLLVGGVTLFFELVPWGSGYAGMFALSSPRARPGTVQY